MADGPRQSVIATWVQENPLMSGAVLVAVLVLGVFLAVGKTKPLLTKGKDITAASSGTSPAQKVGCCWFRR